MNTKLKSLTAALGAVALCLATACTRNRDTAANNSDTAGSTVANDASTTAGTTSDSMAAVNPNPPITAVQTAISSDPSLGSSATNIQVTAENQKLVLRGSVADETMKNKVEQKAKDAASGWQIDNQITVSSQ